jgi:hypothetical protein
MPRIKTTLQALLTVLALTLAPLSFAHADGSQNHTLGVGGMIGDPSGLSLKLRLARVFAIDAGVGFGRFNGGHLHVHMDFLWAAPLLNAPRAEMFFHFGVGPKIALWRDSNPPGNAFDDEGNTWVGVRVPLGLTWEFTRRRLDIFIECAPGFWVFRDLYFTLDASAGARFWF